MGCDDLKDGIEYRTRHAIDELQTSSFLFKVGDVIDGRGTRKSVDDAVAQLKDTLSEALDTARPGGSKERMARLQANNISRRQNTIRGCFKGM